MEEDEMNQVTQDKIQKYKEVKTSIRLITAEISARTGKMPKDISSQDLLVWLDNLIRNPQQKNILNF